MTTTDAEPAILRRNILLRISYDGTRFHGWQKQLQHGKESFRTVQGEIERALALLHKHPVELFGSGRTDAGVHACGQAAHFFTDIARIKPESFIPALNSALPKDIRIMEATNVSDNLHARFSARSAHIGILFTAGEPPLHTSYPIAGTYGANQISMYSTGWQAFCRENWTVQRSLPRAIKVKANRAISIRLIFLPIGNFSCLKFLPMPFCGAWYAR